MKKMLEESLVEKTVAHGIDLSIVAPAHNEEENISGLVSDVAEAMRDSGLTFEMIIVDDGSTDRTLARIHDEMSRYSWLCGLKILNTPDGRGNGQAAAFYAGIRRAQGRLIALIDADRQNDPADIPGMIATLLADGVDMIQGDRTANRQDTLIKRISSRVGRTFRKAFLHDQIRDTGCSLRVFKREVGLALPLQYRGMHRFIPYYAGLLGFRVVEMPVIHRPRVAGKTKYGIWDRALPGLRDLLAVRWMTKRLCLVTCSDLQRELRARHEVR